MGPQAGFEIWNSGDVIDAKKRKNQAKIVIAGQI